MSQKPPMTEKEFPGQHEGETVEMLFRQHPLVMRKALVLGLLAITLAVLPLDFEVVYTWPGVVGWLYWLAFGMPVVVILAWAYRWMEWYFSMYIVTNTRILEIRQQGFFDRRVEEWQLDGITNLNYHIGGFQAVIFGYGDIVARTYVGDFEMKTIHKPAEIHDQLLEVVRKAGGGGSTRPPALG
jgi:hypothetical protein